MGAFLAGILAAFAFGTIWFWLVVAAVVIAITALAENDKGTGATFTLIGTVLFLNFVSKIPILSYVPDHKMATVVYIVAFFFIGVWWGVAEWFFYLRENSVRYEEAKADFLKEEDMEELTPEAAKRFIRDLEMHHNSYCEDVIEINPQFKEHKADILRWMTYWPFLAFWRLVNDPVRKLFQLIASGLEDFLQKMSDRMSRNAVADRELARQYEQETKKKVDELEQALRNGRNKNNVKS